MHYRAIVIYNQFIIHNMKHLFTGIILLLFALPANASQEQVGKIDSLLLLYHEQNNFYGSVLIAKQGEILYSRGFGYASIEHGIPNSEDTKYRIASNSKQFTAMLVLQKVAEGKMDLDANIREYIPAYPAPQGDVIKIHHLLSHTSGMPHYAGIPDFFSLYGRKQFEHEEFVALFSGLELLSEPGTQYSYSSFGYYLLGYILELVSGMSYPDLLEKRILAPLGMEDTGVEDHRSILKNSAFGYNMILDGFERAEFRDLSTALATGDMYSTPLDMLKWDAALRNFDLLEEEMQALLFRPNLDGYGYGWTMGYREVVENDSVYYQQHTGGTNGFTTIGTRLPGDGYYILVYCNTRPAEIREVEGNIIRILYGHEPEFRLSLPVVAGRILKEEGIKALMEFVSGLASDPGYDLRPGDIRTTGNNLTYLGMHEEAIALFRHAASLFPEEAGIKVLLGDAYLAAEKREKAIRAYARALLLDPGQESVIERIRQL